jgi:2-octaprenyl-6-methoxyphenol hydroxylase
MSDPVDVLIVGGGLVGQSLCCALDGSGLRVLQIEAETPRAADSARWDERNFALARRSVMALERWGVFALAAGEARAIEHVHVSSRGDFGAVRIHAEEQGVPALGHTVPARAIGAALTRRLSGLQSIERLSGASLRGLQSGVDAVAADVEHDGRHRTIRARLLVGADGTASTVREWSGIATHRHDYAQTAIVATLEADGAPPGWAFERFTETGPFALLPLSGGRVGLVWTHASESVEAVLALDDAAFVAQAQQAFGWRAGRFLRVGRRRAWPLALTRAERVAASRTVLIGNAAQTIHPIGAQGFNLGLRDVAELAQRLTVLAQSGGDPGDPAALAAYADARSGDREQTIAWSDTLARQFTRQTLPLRVLRSLALGALERAPLIKQHVAWSMMGWREPVSS